MGDNFQIFSRKTGPLKANLIVLLILALALGPFSFKLESGLPAVELGVKSALAVNPNKTIFITSTASTTWTVPADWNNASNTIEVIGGGGSGANAAASAAGGGGGGGAYAKVSNVTLPAGSDVGIKIGAGGTAPGNGVAGNNGGDTWLCNSTANCGGIASSSVVVGAKGGGGGPLDGSGAGGASSTSVGDIKYSGGNGGADCDGGNSGGGGGGAGGPNTTSTPKSTGAGGGGHGAGGGGDTSPGVGGGGGGNGGGSDGLQGLACAGASSGSGGRGGNNYLGSGGGAAGTAGTNGGGGGGGNDGGSGGAGATSTSWIQTSDGQTAGSGGGGGGGGDQKDGGNGGLYGGGGGGAEGNAGAGAQGIIVITYAPIPSYEQSAYKWYANNNSSTVGAELTPGVQDASTMLSSAGAAFRLRTLIHVSNATATVAQDDFKLQYASTTPGNCGPDFYSSSAFVDVGTASGEIRYNNNALPLDGDLVVSTSTDPTHGGDSRINQTYEEQNNFTVTSTVSAGADGKWDFSLIDAAAPAGTTYCFRVVKSDGTFIATSTSSKIPEIKTFAANSAPSVSAVVLNSGSAIILTPAATTTITVVASTTDPDGPGDIRYATSTIYRSGVGANCTTENLNCYQIASSSCSFTDTTSTVKCTALIWYFAQATDSSSTFPSENWLSKITVTDSVGNTGSSTSAGVELNTLLAINVTTSSINYGTVLASSTTGSTNQTTTVENAGNASTSLALNGTALVFNTNELATSSQHYATSSFSYGGAEQALQENQTTVSGFLLTSPSSTNSVSSIIYWGLGVLAGKPTGTYSGVNVFTAVFSP